MSIILVCELEIDLGIEAETCCELEIDLEIEAETYCQRCRATFINKIA